MAEDGEDGEDGDASASFTASRSAPPSRSATHQAEQAGEPDQETQCTMRRCGFPKIGGGNDVNTKFVVGPFIQVIYCNLNYRGTIFRFQVLFSRISQNELELKRWLLSSNGTLY